MITSTTHSVSITMLNKDYRSMCNSFKAKKNSAPLDLLAEADHNYTVDKARIIGWDGVDSLTWGLPFNKALRYLCDAMEKYGAIYQVVSDTPNVPLVNLEYGIFEEKHDYLKEYTPGIINSFSHFLEPQKEKHIESPAKYLTEAITDAITKLKEQGYSLSDIRKALTSTSKSAMNQLGKENSSNVVY